jgi:hypothetical protein
MNSAQLILVTPPIRRRLESWVPSQALERIEAAVMDRRLELRSGPPPPKGVFSCGEADEGGSA